MVGQLLDLVIFHPLQLLGSRLAQAAAQQGQQGILQLHLGNHVRSPLAFTLVQECGLFFFKVHLGSILHVLQAGVFASRSCKGHRQGCSDAITLSSTLLCPLPSDLVVFVMMGLVFILPDEDNQ